ncbi:MAG: hypothetical protein ACP6IY_19730 [Promethearchaeia archaeon]
MAVRREGEQRYSAFYESLKNFLYYNSGYNVGGVARWGSRTTGDHKDKSDLDVIFWIIGDPPKHEVYPQLIEKLKKILNVHADFGSSRNVIKIWKDWITCDLVLLTRSEYENQIRMRRM